MLANLPWDGLFHAKTYLNRLVIPVNNNNNKLFEKLSDLYALVRVRLHRLEANLRTLRMHVNGREFVCVSSSAIYFANQMTLRMRYTHKH